MNFIITYQKSNGVIFTRNRTTLYNLSIGDETSMGWKVLNIHYLYEGNYYTYLDYCKVVRNQQLKKKRNKRFLKYVIKQLNKFV